MGRTAIPASQIDHAQTALQEHITVLHKTAEWLKENNYPSISILFFILCMEEISKSYMMAECKGNNRDVTRGDMKTLYSHKNKLEAFLQNTGDASNKLKHAESGSSDTLDYVRIAATLESMKERAVYFEHRGGNAVTLGGILGSRVSSVASLLQNAVMQGISAMNAHIGSKPASDTRQTLDQNGDDFHTILDKVMDCSQALLTGTSLDPATVIPKGDFDTLLQSLANHIGDLDEVAAMLHNSEHLYSRAKVRIDDQVSPTPQLY